MGIWPGPAKEVHKMEEDARCGNVKFGFHCNSNEKIYEIFTCPGCYAAKIGS
jgi:hypothetical protein